MGIDQSRDSVSPRPSGDRVSLWLRWFRAFGSLRLTVMLLVVCVVVLAWATLLEKWYGEAASRAVVYGTSWFAILNALLAVNILSSIVARFPLRWRQLPFLLTHVGILVLLVGCLETRQNGAEAQLSVTEGRTAHIALQDGLHFELEVISKEKNRAKTIVVPFVPGPFDWNRYAELPWFPWRMVFRSKGLIYQAEGIALETRGYMAKPQPSAQVRLTVDGRQEDFDLTAFSTAPPDAVKPCEVLGQNRRVRIALRQNEMDLGFQVRLHHFYRRLDPGASTASHYSSVVDLLSRGGSPPVLKKNVLITLNAPADFTDPVTHRTYRIFQSAFDGPWRPGEPEFDQIVGKDRSRERVFISRFSVNYDPGRWPKYIGCFMIVLGIFLTCCKGGAQTGPGGGANSRSGYSTKAALLLPLFLGLVPGVCQADEVAPQLQWSAWQHLPVFGEGRVVPLDTFAIETVENICGAANPTLTLPDGPTRRCSAAELIFYWLAAPEKWEKTPFLVADEEVLRRDILKIPLHDKEGRRLRYASPHDVEQCDALGKYWEQLETKTKAQGGKSSWTTTDKKVESLINAYAKYRLLTYNADAPTVTPRRFFLRLRSAAAAWRKLAVAMQGGRRVDNDTAVRNLMVQAGESLQKLIALSHGEKFPREELESAASQFRRTAFQLSVRLAKSKDKPMLAMAANLQHQTIELCLAIFDDGETMKIVPALNPGALEEDREPEDDASPWLGFQTVMYASDRLLNTYPEADRKAVREAWGKLKSAYLAPEDSKRAERFNVAMEQFTAAVRKLGERIEPLRQKLSIRCPDQNAIAMTAYPPPDSTDVEVLYNQSDLFFWAWVLSLVAAICLLPSIGLGWRLYMSLFGILVLVASQVCLAAGLVVRGYIMGLVPLTGMFETVVAVALYASLFGLCFSFYAVFEGQGLAGALNRKPFLTAGAMVSFLATVLAYYAPASVMHRHIGSVMPILRDNFWLAVHVLTIMASYATAAIALVLGNAALGYYLFGQYPKGRSPKVCKRLAGFIYSTIQVTVLLLAAGTVLGAFWADKAWGRFWAWDPKEVWALISLLVYLGILHARLAGWAADFGMALAAVFGATAVLFTWYGVNFLLASGMHSYGSGAGGQWAVASAVGAQWLFLLLAACRYAISRK